MKVAFWFLLVCVPIMASSEPFQIRMIGPQSKDDMSQIYFEELFKRALLNALVPDSDVELIKVPYTEALHGGAVRLLNNDIIDLFLSASDKELDKQILPVKIPLVMGLLGYRVAITHADNLDTLRKIGNPKSLKACQVRHWPDVKVLQFNDFTVVPTNNFERTFELTYKKRCDYFPRAIYEGYEELRSAQQRFPDLVMFDDIMLYYPYPMYIYMKKSNIRLHNLFTVGLNKMIDSGELLQLIKESEITSHLFPLSKWQDKTIIPLDNPFLPKDTPFDDSRLWIDLTSLD